MTLASVLVFSVPFVVLGAVGFARLGRVAPARRRFTAVAMALVLAYGVGVLGWYAAFWAQGPAQDYLFGSLGDAAFAVMDVGGVALQALTFAAFLLLILAAVRGERPAGEAPPG